MWKFSMHIIDAVSVLFFITKRASQPWTSFASLIYLAEIYYFIINDLCVVNIEQLRKNENVTFNKN